jgi:SAM-dependent methyltransferase
MQTSINKAGINTWLEFWNGPNSIYAGCRHRRLHGEIVSRDIAALIPSREATLLDYGCGEASEAEFIAARCKRLILSDGAAGIVASLTERYNRHSKIAVVPADEVRSLPRSSIDLIILNSVIQYLSRREFHQLLSALRPLLKDSGLLVVGDVIQPNEGALTDAVALLRFGFKGGFLTSALLGLLMTFFSDYRRLRSKLGLSCYSEKEMLSMLRGAGFLGDRHGSNIGHNRNRMTFTASTYTTVSGISKKQKQLVKVAA